MNGPAIAIPLPVAGRDGRVDRRKRPAGNDPRFRPVRGRVRTPVDQAQIAFRTRVKLPPR